MHTGGRIYLMGVLTCLFFTGHVAAQHCSDWQVRKLENAPDWYLATIERPRASSEVKLTDSLTRIDYQLKDGVTLVQYWRDAYDQQDDPKGSPYIAPGSLYLCGTDTTLLDSNLCGFSILSFNEDSTQCVAGRLWTITDNGHRSSVVLYDLENRQKSVLRSWIEDAGPQCAPAGTVAYSDAADLYIFDPMSMDEELIFQRGGSFAVGECAGNRIYDLRWADNSLSLVFKYRGKGANPGVYELFEVYWSPVGDSMPQKQE